jgi:hypothetical protein
MREYLTADAVIDLVLDALDLPPAATDVAGVARQALLDSRAHALTRTLQLLTMTELAACPTPSATKERVAALVATLRDRLAQMPVTYLVRPDVATGQRYEPATVGGEALWVHACGYVAAMTTDPNDDDADAHTTEYCTVPYDPWQRLHVEANPDG